MEDMVSKPRLYVFRWLFGVLALYKTLQNTKGSYVC